MCGRYWLDPEGNEQLRQIISQINRADDIKTCGEIFPGDRVSVLCKSRAGSIRAFAMEWGYRMPDGKRMINARCETAAQKPLFRDGMAMRRCALPMSAYFEWEKCEGGKLRRRISPSQGGLHYLAGIYRFEGENPVCTVLTTAAAREIAFIHHRMPVILTADERDGWIGGGEMDFGRAPSLIWT